MKKSIKIRKVSDLIAYVEHNCTKGLHLFRGQPADKSLLPKLARPVIADRYPGEKLLELEKPLLEQFTLRGRAYLTIPDNPWDLLALAQHHGLATRLLDWTDNPLAALWFSVRENSQGEECGAVWVLDVPDEDIVRPEETKKPGESQDDPFTEKRTRVFQPRHITNTIAAQGGWFTVHKYVRKRRFIRLEINTQYKEKLAKLLVERESFPDLARQLSKCGIHSASMFPTMGGLSEYLNWTISVNENKREV